MHSDGVECVRDSRETKCHFQKKFTYTNIIGRQNYIKFYDSQSAGKIIFHKLQVRYTRIEVIHTVKSISNYFDLIRQ